MVVMEDCGDLLTEMGLFLRETLAHEHLSENAQNVRQKLLAKLRLRKEVSPSPNGYIDMDCGLLRSAKVQNPIPDLYEEFDQSREKGNRSVRQIPDSYENNLYNNLSSLHEENIYEHDSESYSNLRNSNQTEDNTYTCPSSPLANTPVHPSKLCLPNRISSSNNNVEQNSKKECTDKNSDSSSITSSSTRCDEYPEVLAMSASALRCPAVKCGVLSRREKFWFTKRYWVAALKQTLYMFNTEKDSKPVSQLDIAGYKARAVDIAGITRNEFKFELVCPGKKTHQFSVEKESEMELWISSLNQMELESSLDQLPQLNQLPDIINSKSTQIEDEYELPPVPRPVSSIALSMKHEAHFKDRRFSDQSERYVRSYIKDGRELPQLPHNLDTTDSADEPLDYEVLQEEVYDCIRESETQKTVDTLRPLPLLPHELEMYDCPEPTIRPVNPPIISPINLPLKPLETGQENTNGTDNNHQEVIYDNVEHIEDLDTTVNKNIENMNNKNVEEENTYLNVDPYPETETDQETIYDVISEQRPIPSFEERKASFIKTSPISSALNDELKLKTGGKAGLTNNMATIFNKSLKKPIITAVKPPVLNKISPFKI